MDLIEFVGVEFSLFSEWISMSIRIYADPSHYLWFLNTFKNKFLNTDVSWNCRAYSEWRMKKEFWRKPPRSILDFSNFISAVCQKRKWCEDGKKEIIETVRLREVPNTYLQWKRELLQKSPYKYMFMYNRQMFSFTNSCWHGNVAMVW